MSTLCTVMFVEKLGTKEIPLVNLRFFCDGYISGVGHDLAQFIMDHELVNGITFDMTSENYANGVGCLVAQYISKFKGSFIGHLYVIPMIFSKEEYNYKVTISVDDEGGPVNGTLSRSTNIVVTDWDDAVIFAGSPKNLLVFDE